MFHASREMPCFRLGADTSQARDGFSRATALLMNCFSERLTACFSEAVKGEFFGWT